LGGPQNYFVQAIAQVINSPTDGTLPGIADGFELPAVPAGEFLGCPGAGNSAGYPLTVSRDAGVPGIWRLIMRDHGWRGERAARQWRRAWVPRAVPGRNR
jgi:hypothetical protein